MLRSMTEEDASTTLRPAESSCSADDQTDDQASYERAISHLFAAVEAAWLADPPVIEDDTEYGIISIGLAIDEPTFGFDPLLRPAIFLDDGLNRPPREAYVFLDGVGMDTSLLDLIRQENQEQEECHAAEAWDVVPTTQRNSRSLITAVRDDMEATMRIKNHQSLRSVAQDIHSIHNDPQAASLHRVQDYCRTVEDIESFNSAVAARVIERGTSPLLSRTNLSRERLRTELKQSFATTMSGHAQERANLKAQLKRVEFESDAPTIAMLRRRRRHLNQKIFDEATTSLMSRLAVSFTAENSDRAHELADSYALFQAHRAILNSETFDAAEATSKIVENCEKIRSIFNAELSGFERTIDALNRELLDDLTCSVKLIMWMQRMTAYDVLDTLEREVEMKKRLAHEEGPAIIMKIIAETAAIRSSIGSMVHLLDGIDQSVCRLVGAVLDNLATLSDCRICAHITMTKQFPAQELPHDSDTVSIASNPTHFGVGQREEATEQWTRPNNGASTCVSSMEH